MVVSAACFMSATQSHGFSDAMVVSAAKVCGSSEHCWRIRMTHWPTLVSSCGKFCSFLQNESSNPTLDGSQLRSSHSRQLFVRLRQ